MGKSMKASEEEQNEEYRIVADAAPENRCLMCGPFFKRSSEHSEEILEKIGIHKDGYDMAKVSKALNSMGKKRFRHFMMGLDSKSPSNADVSVVRSRAIAYNSNSVLTPEQIYMTMHRRPDIAAINIANGVLQMAASVRKYSNIPLLSKHGEDSLVDDEDKEALKDMMAYRNKVISEYTVEEPTGEQKKAWTRMFLRVMAKAYTIASESYKGGN